MRQKCNSPLKKFGTVRQKCKHLSKNSAQWDKIVVQLTNFYDTVRQICNSRSSHKNFDTVRHNCDFRGEIFRTVGQNCYSPHKFLNTVRENCKSPLKTFGTLRQSVTHLTKFPALWDENLKQLITFSEQ